MFEKFFLYQTNFKVTNIVNGRLKSIWQQSQRLHCPMIDRLIETQYFNQHAQYRQDSGAPADSIDSIEL